MTFTREIKFIPAYNRISEGYGRHNMEIVFLLKGLNGVVALTMYTGWYTPQDQKEFFTKPRTFFQRYPWGADLSIHSPVQLSEYDIRHATCDWLGGKECFCQGSSLCADAIMDEFLEKGEEVIWEKLQEWYDHHLKESLMFDI